MYTNYMDNSKSDRLRLLIEDKNPGYVYQILSRNYRESVESLKSKFIIELNMVRQRILIRSKYENELLKLLNYLYSNGVRFESVCSDCLRIDFSQLIFKLR